jgi:hypothetical protein
MKYILADGFVNKPNFPAYIRFYNKHSSKIEYGIDCSISSMIIYQPMEIIFLTTEHTWFEGDTYYVTIDEGVLYSSNSMNSTAYTDPNFWQFSVVASVFHRT